MATSITTQPDLQTYTTISDNELSRLETERMKADNWATFHTQAWAKFLRMMARRRPTWVEADIDDTSEVKYVVCYLVIFLAYDAAEFLSEEDRRKRKYWWRKYRDAFAEVRITRDGTVWAPEMYTNRRSLRG